MSIDEEAEVAEDGLDRSSNHNQEDGGQLGREIGNGERKH